MQTAVNSKLSPTHSLPNPSHYVRMLQGEFAQWALDQESGMEAKGHWRSRVFEVSERAPLDLEIGTGNGFFFTNQCKNNPERSLVGLEITYKTLIQSIKRAVASGSKNMRMVRFHASNLENLFEKNELDNVFIHFPDPWPKKRHAKNRLFQTEFLNTLYDLQKLGSFVDFKTDSLDYFKWSLERIQTSKYKITRITNDLHKSEWANENFMTHFEKLWTSKGIKSNYIRLEKTL